MNTNADVTAFVAAFDEPLRGKLKRVRSLIRRAAPQATEVISNGMPGYVLHDSLVWFAGVGEDVALYPRGHHFKKVYAAELVGYRTLNGAILFPSSAPLPATLITKIVKDRVRENTLNAMPRPSGIPEKLGAPAKRALANARISSLAILAQHTEAEILALHGIGPGSLPALRAALQAAGLKFRPNERS